MAMIYSSNGLHLTEQFEGDVLHAYRDTTGVWTIGYGHTGAEVVRGLAWTQQQAEEALAKDIQWAATVVNGSISLALSQCEFDALVDFVFNVGAGHFLRSTLRASINGGDLEAAAAEFEKWSNAGGKLVAGLLRRRQAEAAEFSSTTEAI